MNVNSKKTQKRPTIADAIDSTLIIVQCVNDVKKQVDEKQNQYYHWVLTFLIVVGSIETPEQYLVHFDNFIYMATQFLDALDIAFKIYNVFNLKYSTFSKKVWNFIQKFFYHLPLDARNENSTIYKLICDISKE